MREYVSRASIQVFVLIISFVISGCGGGGSNDSTGGNTSPASLTAISVTPTNQSIAKGTTKQFAAIGTYSDNTTKDLTASVNWSSSNSSIATISNAGLATGAITGATSIQAKDPTSGVSGSTNLTVTAAQLVSIEITPVNPSIAKATTKQFAATGVFSDSTTQDLTAQVTWSSSNTGVASIDSKGFATALTTGTTTISAASGSISESIALTVTSATLTSISVTPANPSVAKGLQKQFTATGTFTDATTQDLTGQVVWSSSNTGVATVSNSGMATSVAIGSATITATSGTISGSTALTVTAATLTSISVTAANPSIVLGTTNQFTATGTYTDGTTQNLTTSVTWSSSNTATATISNAAGSNGLATSVAVGTTTITAIDPATGISGASALTVTTAHLISISVTPANVSIPLGTTQQFTATGTYSDNTTQDLTTAVTWSSSNTGSVTISKASRKNAASKVTKTVHVSNASSSKGLATAVAVGTATITATDSASGISGTSTLTVTGTNVSGIINANTVWTKGNSPYIITSNLGIEKNVILTIEPGVQVLVDGYYYIGAKGTIVANGTVSDPIVFSSTNPPGYDSYNWQGIQFLTDIDGSQTWQGSLFNHVEIAYAHRGIYSNTGIGNSDPLITIQNSQFHTIGYDGIYLWGIPSKISDNYFTKLNLGNSRPGFSFAVDARGPTITRNVVENSISSGIRGNVNCSPCSKPTISDNRLNNLGGVGIDGTQSIISTNLIFNNTGDAGIVVNSDSEVRYNAVYNNKVGILSQFGNFIISNNNVFSNLDYNFKTISANDVNASNNWWGTVNTLEIDRLIYDYYDDFTLGKVNYLPLLTSPEPNAPH